MAAVLEFADVTVRRGQATLLDGITWRSRRTSAGWSSAPTAPARPRCSRSPPAQIHPTTGVAGILGEVLGTVDVFELRPRIGLTSAALAERIPRDERVRDVVVSASYGVRRPLARGLRRPRPRPRRRAARRGRRRATWPTARFGTLPRASASGCRSPGR